MLAVKNLCLKPSDSIQKESGKYPYQEHTLRSLQSFDKVAWSAADPAQTKTNNEVIQVDHWRIDRSDAWGGNYKLKYILSLLINY